MDINTKLSFLSHKHIFILEKYIAVLPRDVLYVMEYNIKTLRILDTIADIQIINISYSDITFIVPSLDITLKYYYNKNLDIYHGEFIKVGICVSRDFIGSLKTHQFIKIYLTRYVCSDVASIIADLACFDKVIKL